MSLLNQKFGTGSAIGTRSQAVSPDGHYLAPPQDADGKVWVRTNAIVLADAQVLYAMWHDVEAGPKWQEQVREVVKTGPTTSRWVMVKGDKTLTWDSEVLADEPGKRIVWRTTGGDIEAAGEVIFEPLPTGRGTMVTVLQEFKMGKLAIAWDTLTGHNHRQRVIESLRHFKALAETGEIPRTHGQPHGPRGLTGSTKSAAYGEEISVPPESSVRHAS